MTLGQLDRCEEGIAVFDEVDRRYGKDDSAALREQVANALVYKCITFGQLDRREDGIAVIDEVDRRYGKDDSPALREQVAKTLIFKGITLGHLCRSEEAIAIYDEIESRYGNDATPGLRQQVARALNARAFARILQAKQDWEAETERHQLLSLAMGDLDHAQKWCAEVDRVNVYGTFSYAMFLSGEVGKAEESSRECLLLGGSRSLQEQRDNAQTQRVEPVDSEYEKLLDRLWNELQTKPELLPS
jgi:tetratricopeptide (TPR) repeat protein